MEGCSTEEAWKRQEVSLTKAGDPTVQESQRMAERLLRQKFVVFLYSLLFCSNTTVNGHMVLNGLNSNIGQRNLINPHYCL